MRAQWGSCGPPQEPAAAVCVAAGAPSLPACLPDTRTRRSPASRRRRRRARRTRQTPSACRLQPRTPRSSPRSASSSRLAEGRRARRKPRAVVVERPSRCCGGPTHAPWRSTLIWHAPVWSVVSHRSRGARVEAACAAGKAGGGAVAAGGKGGHCPSPGIVASGCMPLRACFCLRPSQSARREKTGQAQPRRLPAQRPTTREKLRKRGGMLSRLIEGEVRPLRNAAPSLALSALGRP